VAAVLSALIPGLGQCFLGRRDKAIAFLSALAVMAIAFWPVRLLRLYEGLITLLLAAILLFNIAVFDAMYSRDGSTVRRLSLGWIPLGLLIGYIGLNITFTSFLFCSGFRALQYTSSTMEPLLNNGDRLVYDKRYYPAHSKLRGDVIVMHTKGGVTVRRIVGLPGDNVEGKERIVYLNGQIQDESFVKHKYPLGNDPSLDSFGPITVPAGKYFVMGDNRDISLDSRRPDFGLVSDDAIIGKALYSYKIGFGPGPVTRRLN
jgi:signal peptidase I